MEMKFHVKYDDGLKKFQGLEYYYGAQSLLGVSQVLMISLNAFFHRHIITQAPAAKGFQIILGKSKLGSWDQALTLILTDPETIKIAQELGKNALYDLLKWALVGALGTPFVLKYRKAKKVIRVLEQENDDLHFKLEEAIKRIHQPVKHQGLTVQIMSGRTNLATFDDMSLQFIETEIVDDKAILLEVGVSRFNARTGTGRFIDDEDAVSVPFYPVNDLTLSARQILADSLRSLVDGIFVPVKVSAYRVSSADGRLKSYQVETAWK